MSTRATVVCADNFHFYEELLDNDHLYLEVDGAACEVNVQRIEPAEKPAYPYVSVNVRLTEEQWAAIADAVHRRQRGRQPH